MTNDMVLFADWFDGHLTRKPAGADGKD